MRLMIGDCLERMKEIEDGYVDLVLTDPPYGTTACKWDAVIPFESMWAQVWRVLKPNGAAVFTASQPFTTRLISSQIDKFCYELIWDKGRGFEPGLAKLRPQKSHENCIVFSKNGKMPAYFPQMEPLEFPVTKRGNYSNKGLGILSGSGLFEKTYNSKYPRSVMPFSNSNQSKKQHPTQKPVALMEYLIRTYTNEGETVLDFTMGSGTTGVACSNTNRNFIGIERDPTYFQIAKDRIAEAQHKLI